MSISLIVAADENGCIGYQGKMLWHIPEELAYFYRMIRGKLVIMGRKTWESIPVAHRPLAGCTTVVLTRQPGYAVPEGVIVMNSLESALRAYRDEPEIMIAGGGEVYEQTLDLATIAYFTRVHREEKLGDCYFETLNPDIWEEVSQKPGAEFTLFVYRRRS